MSELVAFVGHVNIVHDPRCDSSVESLLLFIVILHQIIQPVSKRMVIDREIRGQFVTLQFVINKSRRDTLSISYIIALFYGLHMYKYVDKIRFHDDQRLHIPDLFCCH